MFCKWDACWVNQDLPAYDKKEEVEWKVLELPGEAALAALPLVSVGIRGESNNICLFAACRITLQRPRIVCCWSKNG